jgi:two-component system, NtrC family, sensor kinase
MNRLCLKRRYVSYHQLRTLRRTGHCPSRARWKHRTLSPCAPVAIDTATIDCRLLGAHATAETITVMPDAAAPQDSLPKPSEQTRSRRATVRLLRILAGAALLLPLLLFLFASWLSYRATQALADERIERSLEVMQEQALKVFQSMNLALNSIDDLLGALSEREIAADEARLHQRLRQIQRELPEVQSIWIFGPAGHPQVITREYPAPESTDFSTEDYFQGPRDGQAGVYVGGIHQSVSGGEPYFTFDRARHDPGGRFSGVIEMSVLPSDFGRFYSDLASSAGLQLAMVRSDGTLLARYPPLPGELRLDERSGFRRTTAASPAGGFYTAKSTIDDVERRVGVRRLPGYPLYVVAGIDTAEIRKEWMGAMALHLIFGIPATAFLFGSLLFVLQRTKRLYDEQDRREAAEVVMRQSQRLDAIGQLTGGVAHDFNNLLTIIMGNIETAQRLLDSWTDGAHIKLARRLENAMAGAERAATLTKRLLAFSRQQPLAPTALDVNRILNGISDFLRQALGETISLEIVGSGGVWPVQADRAELEAAILNLAVNARDAMPDGGKLTIEASNSHLDEVYCRQYPDVKPGQFVQIAVSDTGAGMAKDVLERAFEPFFTTKQSGQGTGLGLSQVYGFVKQSGGHVKIYSELGEGTSVKIYLPRSSAKYESREATAEAAARGRPDERILVVEDDADVRAYVVETLGSLGYHVLQAAGASEALELLDQHQAIDLLLTDVVMPGVNGRRLAEEAKQRNPALKVVFMTGYSRNAIAHQGRLDPGVTLIQKPLTSALLAAAVRQALDS